MNDREQFVLANVLADKRHYSAQEVTAFGGDRFARARHNRIVNEARQGIVPLDPSRWLGRPPTASEATLFCRSYAALERRGFVARLAGMGGRTTHLKLTPEGERIAAELLNPTEGRSDAPAIG
jgi:hypothetical protein